MTLACMTIALATLHPYVLEFDAIVTHINNDGSIELDKTYFYPTGGGQPHDSGVITRNDEQFQVLEVKKGDCNTVHIMSKPGLAEGDAVHCVIDKERRELHRRMHTACHILCAVLEQKENAKVTGNQIGIERTRIDFGTEQFSPERLQEYIAEANRIIGQGLAVRKFVTGRDELLANPKLVKLAAGFPEHVIDVHMVEIKDFDTQPCSGTHVDNTLEIGQLVFDKAESKGRNNRRVYFRLISS
jgi:misacylated tRNA(Ala) deacylase